MRIEIFSGINFVGKKVASYLNRFYRASARFLIFMSQFFTDKVVPIDKVGSPLCFFRIFIVAFQLQNRTRLASPGSVPEGFKIVGKAILRSVNQGCRSP